jgi:hypothetical protein
MNKIANLDVDYHVNGLSIAVLVDGEKDFLDCAHLKNDDKMINKTEDSLARRLNLQLLRAYP